MTGIEYALLQYRVAGVTSVFLRQISALQQLLPGGKCALRWKLFCLRFGHGHNRSSIVNRQAIRLHRFIELRIVVQHLEAHNKGKRVGNPIDRDQVLQQRQHVRQAFLNVRLTVQWIEVSLLDQRIHRVEHAQRVGYAHDVISAFSGGKVRQHLLEVRGGSFCELDFHRCALCKRLHIPIDLFRNVDQQHQGV